MARILVVGGSLGGLLAANLLHRAGHDVTVLERSASSLEGRGAGIVTHALLCDALRAAGAVVDHTLGVPVQARVVLRADGSAACRWQYPQILTAWGRLYALLRTALPDACHRLDARVLSVAQDAQGASATLADGQTVHGELLIAADGIRSGVRAALLPAVQPAYAGYVAWRGVCDESLLSRFTRRTLFDAFGFGLPPGEQMIGYPVAGVGADGRDCTEPGLRRWNFVWYRSTGDGAALRALMTDADGVHHPGGIPPNQVSWRAIAAVREAARTKLAPQFAEIVEKTALPFLQPIHDLLSLRMAFERVALLGDAAFVARPHVGMGVTKAAADALALAESIASEGATPAALRRYEALRRAENARVVGHARRLGGYLEAQHQGLAASREPEDVMLQTAVDLRLLDAAFPEARAA